MTTSLQNSLYVYNTQVVLNASVVHLAANQHACATGISEVSYIYYSHRKKKNTQHGLSLDGESLSACQPLTET